MVGLPKADNAIRSDLAVERRDPLEVLFIRRARQRNSTICGIKPRRAGHVTSGIEKPSDPVERIETEALDSAGSILTGEALSEEVELIPRARRGRRGRERCIPHEAELRAVVEGRDAVGRTLPAAVLPHGGQIVG